MANFAKYIIFAKPHVFHGSLLQSLWIFVKALFRQNHPFCVSISISFKTFANFPRFRNLNSTVPIDVVPVKSYVDSLHRSGQLRDQFLSLTMTTVLWIETHQSWARFVIHQSLTTTVVRIVRLSKSTLSTIKLYPLYTLSTICSSVKNWYFFTSTIRNKS